MRILPRIRIVLPIVLLIIVITVIITTVSFRPLVFPIPSSMADDLTTEYDSHNYSLPGVYFSIKASESYSYSRLTPSAVTWFRKVPPKNVFIVTDNKDNLTETIARLGYNVYYAVDCPLGHTRLGLLCKNGKEFSIYYEQVEAGNNFNWYCHLDDDVYINIGELEKVLVSLDPNEAHYIGRIGDLHFNVTKAALDYYSNKIKKKIFSFACGGVYCISKNVMSKIEAYVSISTNPKQKQNIKLLSLFHETAICLVCIFMNHFDTTSVFARGNNLTKTNKFVEVKGDDVTVGFVIESLHGYEVFDLGRKIQLQYWLHETGNFKEKIAVSYKLRLRNKKLVGTNVPIPNPVFSFNDDPTRFLSYHCLLYPTESWCQSRTVPKLESIYI